MDIIMDSATVDDWLNLLMSQVIEPSFAKEDLVFVCDFPASQAALSRIQDNASGQPVAKRFEAFHGGFELANGYWELADAEEQRLRFELDLQKRQQAGSGSYPIDEKLLHAMEHGLPECAGVAIGVDRLLMAQAGADHIDQVIAFTLS